MKWHTLNAPAAAALWIGGGLLTLQPDVSARAARPGTAMLLLAALLFGRILLALGLRWSQPANPRSRIGLQLGLLGLGLFGAAQLVRALALVAPTLHMPISALGLLLLCGGLIVIGASALEASVEPGWQALPLMLGLSGLFLPIGAGVAGLPGLMVWTLFGAGWCWLGAILGAESGEPRTKNLEPRGRT